MAEITFTIPTESEQDIIDTIKWLKPVPQIEDPENPGVFINEFTDIVWVEKFIRSWIISQVTRYKKNLSMHTNILTIIDDENLINE